MLKQAENAAANAILDGARVELSDAILYHSDIDDLLYLESCVEEGGQFASALGLHNVAGRLDGLSAEYQPFVKDMLVGLLSAVTFKYLWPESVRVELNSLGKKARSELHGLVYVKVEDSFA